MHAHHEILVKASDGEEAIASAEEAIAGYGNSDAWDWYVVGGRWSGFHTQMRDGEWPEERDQYRDGGYKDDALCYADDPELFRACLENQIEAQRKELRLCLGRLKFKDKLRLLFNRVKVSHDGEDGMFGHYLYGIGKCMAGYYNFSSYFYNAEWGGPEMPSEMWAEIEAAPEQWWLVTVDLHA